MQSDNMGVRTSEVLLPPSAPDLSEEPIDAVVTWVDGNDPAHLAKRQEALRKLGKAARQILPAGTAALRFSDNGELFWCLHSIRKFAPWIRHIHLVTDNQVPAFLTPTKQNELGIRIVDHREIFKNYERALPTFNSRAIETVLWRIPNLAENFIYLNDDFLLLQPVPSDHFFTSDKVVLRGKWSIIRPLGTLGRCLEMGYSAILHQLFSRNRTMHLQAQMRGARKAGLRFRYYRVPHHPHSLRVSTFSRYFDVHPWDLRNNIAPVFRSLTNFWPISLANHLEIRSGNAILSKVHDSAMFTAGSVNKDKGKRLLSAIEFPDTFFLCVQEIEQYAPTVQKAVERALSRLLEIE